MFGVEPQPPLDALATPLRVVAVSLGYFCVVCELDSVEVIFEETDGPNCVGFGSSDGGETTSGSRRSLQMESPATNGTDRSEGETRSATERIGQIRSYVSVLRTSSSEP